MLLVELKCVLAVRRRDLGLPFAYPLLCLSSANAKPKKDFFSFFTTRCRKNTEFPDPTGGFVHQVPSLAFAPAPEFLLLARSQCLTQAGALFPKAFNFRVTFGISD